MSRFHLTLKIHEQNLLEQKIAFDFQRLKVRIHIVRKLENLVVNQLQQYVAMLLRILLVQLVLLPPSL